MDALSFHAAGVANAVAPLGTAFTTRQAALLRRRSEKVQLCFDSDSAGKKAAERACSVAVGAGLEADVVLMTAGKDASEILENFGAETLKKVPECAINSGDFLIRRAEELFDIGSMDGKSKASTFFYPYLDALDSEVRRNALLEMVGRRIGVNAESLIADYRKAKTLGAAQGQAPAQGRIKSVAASARMGEAGARTADLFFMIAMIVNDGVIYRPHVLKEIRDPETGALVQSIERDEIERASVSKATFAQVREALRGVITVGSAHVPVSTKAVEIAGKTGTAEIGLKDRWHSWKLRRRSERGLQYPRAGRPAGSSERRSPYRDCQN